MCLSTNVQMFHAPWKYLAETFGNTSIKYFLYTLTLRTFLCLVIYVSEEVKNNPIGFPFDRKLHFGHLDYKQQTNQEESLWILKTPILNTKDVRNIKSEEDAL